MNLAESFLTALDSLLANKLRAVLTMLGVIIGVAAVIALMAIGNGVSESITSEIQAIGTNLIIIIPDSDNSGGYPSLSLDDVSALSDRLNAPAISAVTATISGSREVLYGGRSKRVSVNGVLPNHFIINNLTDFSAGDALTDTDNQTEARVAVIGAEVATDLFEDTFPIGENIRIDGVSYEIVGVLEAKGQGFGNDTDLSVFVPMATAQNRLFSRRTRQGKVAVGAITVQSGE